MKTNDKILKQFINQVRNRFGFKLLKAILFGSQARRNAVSESDYDILFIFDEVTDDIERFIEDAASKILLKKGLLFSTFLLSKEQYQNMQLEPFIVNAQKDGVLL